MLSLWDTRTLVMLCCWPDLCVLDFLLLTEGESASTGMQEGSTMKIMTLAAIESEHRSGSLRKLSVQSLPTMEVLYSLEVSAVSSLVQKDMSMDVLYLLESVSDHSNSPDGPVCGLVLRGFTEAQPENRLNRLLYKHKFEEAEKFALAFELDVELVYKVKLDFILEKLASASVTEQGNDESAKLVEEAKTNLMKIMDEQYVVHYCLNAFWPTLSTAEEMLSYAANRFPSAQIQTALAKLATFCHLYGSDSFSGVSWIEFLNSSNYLKDILAFLKDGHLTRAQYLWLRHEGELAAEFDERSMHALLSSIPSDIPSQDLGIWLQGVVVPFTWRVLPKGQRILARWLEQRARNLELTEKDGWPQNGLMLAELGLPSFWMSRNLTEDCKTEELELLQSLVTNLRHLCDLYTKYNCRLSLSDFEMGSTRSMAFLMLDKVLAPELIPTVIENSVRPYALKHRLDLDQILLDYIKDLLDCCSSQITSLFTEWEAKAIAVLRCMTTTNLVMDAVLEIMYKAVVPWNDAIEKLVQQHLEKEHSKQQLLRESYHLMEIKKLLRCYGIRNLTLSNSRDTMMLVRHILKQNLPTSLEDSLKLAHTYKLDACEIHYMYCIQLLELNERERCIAHLKKLTPADAELVIERLASWARFQLQSKEQSTEVKQLQMLIAQTMEEALKYLQSFQRDDALKRMECENNLKMFTAIAQLQEDFDIFLTPEEYDDPAVRRRFNQQLITAYENTQAWRHSGKKHPDKAGGSLASEVRAAVTNDPDGKSRTLSTEAGLYRLARHLQRTEQELWADLAARALEAGNVEKALKILSELYQHHPNSSTGRVLFCTAQRLGQMLEDNVPMVLPEKVDLPALIHKLACQAITICHSDLLLDCVELCKSTRAAADVYRQCQIDDYDFVAKDAVLSGEEGAYTETSVQDVFHEDGIVLDPLSVLPVQYKITTSLLPLSDSTLHPLSCSCLSYCALQQDDDFVRPLLAPMATMLQSLQECSQLELALRLLLESYGSILQHFVSNNMDISLSLKLHANSRLVRDKQTLDAIEKTALSSIRMVVVSLLQKVLNWRVIDCDLAIGLCTILSKSEVMDILWKIITSAWQNYDKIMAVAMVGGHFCSLYHDEDERKKFLLVITDAEWGIKLGKLGVSIQSVFRQCSETKSSLIPVLVKNKNLTAEILQEYCNTYGLDSDSALGLYITTLLLQEEGELRPAAVRAGDPPLAQGEEDLPGGHEDILERALRIVPELSSTTDLVISLHMALTKLSPYNYERIERVLKTIQTADESTTLLPLGQMLGLLQHLKSHSRISPPTDLESTYLLENSLESTPLANTRLPFHLLLQTSLYFWKIISPELNEETLPTLLLISKLMKVSLDKLYVLTVNHVFKRSLMPLLLDQSRRARGVGPGPSRETDAVVQNLFKHALCIQSPELAVATIHKHSQELPSGPEKTMFLKFSLELVHKLLKSDALEGDLQARGEMLISKLQLQYQRSATENALAASQLDCPELLKLTGLPGRLIVALFEHDSVLERMRSPAGHACPDIHAVAKEIASINGVDLLKVRNILLEKWLCNPELSNNKEIQDQDSVTDLSDDPDLMRVVYLLQMHPMDMSVRLLNPILTAETWPLGGSGLRLSFQHRSRVLLCLIHIADSATLEALSHTPSDKVKHYLKCYVYLSQLEALNIPYNLELFLSSPKEGMIKGLWKNHSNEPRAVRLVADLCVEYEVYDPHLWSGILQKLLLFNMISYLQKILEILRAVPSLLEIPDFCRTWRSVILAPFMTASLPLSPQQQATFYRTFVLLLKCPFLLNLDLTGIAKRFAQFNLMAFSLGSLILIPCSKKRERQIQSFLLSCNPALILDQVEETLATGELAGIPSQIRETVLTFLSKNGQYQGLVETKHFRSLMKHLVLKALSDQVDELVHYLVDHNRKDDAIELAQAYLRCKEPKGRTRTSMNDLCSDPIKEFLAHAMESLGRSKS